jgi:UTP-glucose-1-phosphate uridylyltransferase
MTNSQNAVLATKSAMDIIVLEAKKLVANKFDTSLEMINLAISAQNENVLNMLRDLVSQGVNQVADSL